MLDKLSVLEVHSCAWFVELLSPNTIQGWLCIFDECLRLLQVVKSRKRKIAPSQAAMGPSRNRVRETGLAVERRERKRGGGRVFWLLAFGTVTCVARTCSRAFLK